MTAVKPSGLSGSKVLIRKIKFITNFFFYRLFFFPSRFASAHSFHYIFFFLLYANAPLPLQGQLIQHNPKAGVIVSSGDLALQSIHRSQAGNYTCVASNVEGDGESNTVELKVMCK